MADDSFFKKLNSIEHITQYWGILSNAAPGSQIRFVGEKLKHTVLASSERFLICERKRTKNTVTYTIVDLKYGIRSTFKKMRVENEQALFARALEKMEGEKVLFKNNVILDIDFIEWKK